MLFVNVSALSDVWEDGNLLKVNSCNCAGKLDEAKEGVSMVSITTRMKKSLKRETNALQSIAENKHL